MTRGSWFTSTLCWALVGVIAIAVAPLLAQYDAKELAKPLLLRQSYLLHVLSLIAIYTILAVGVNLLMGYAGQVSLGHAAFYGIGAYTSGILTAGPALSVHCSPLLALPAGVALAGVVAFLVGVPCLRLRGHYLAMATLGFGWIVFIIMQKWTVMTGGISGLREIPRLALGGFAFDSDVKWFYLTAAAALATLVVCANIVNSRVGRALRALHGSERAAATLGVNVAYYKVLVFVLAAMLAAFAGSLYAHKVNFISPNSFGFLISVELVVMVVVGGMASVWGAVIGAAAITLLSEWLADLGQHHAVFQDLHGVAFGLILILVMVFMPAGLTVGVRDLALRWFKRRRPAPAPQPQRQPREVARV